MKSILQEIGKLRRHVPLRLDSQNTDPYRVLVKEEHALHTAYCFGVPVYASKTRRPVELCFREKDGAYHHDGSHAHICVDRELALRNADGAVHVTLQQSPFSLEKTHLKGRQMHLYPTFNGILAKVRCEGAAAFTFFVDSEKTDMPICESSKSFSYMQDVHRPFVTVSVHGAEKQGEIIAPAVLHSKKIDRRRCRITVSTQAENADFLVFEVNLYEPKLFQDTTVDSMHPQENNAFGGVAFLGRTQEMGEQWLYSRLDLSRFSDLSCKKIRAIYMYIPQYGGDKTGIEVLGVQARFCSFGSRWVNKIDPTTQLASAVPVADYQKIDLSALCLDSVTGTLQVNGGFILRHGKENGGFSVLATGDHYCRPPIIEIQYE